MEQSNVNYQAISDTLTQLQAARYKLSALCDYEAARWNATDRKFKRHFPPPWPPLASGPPPPAAAARSRRWQLPPPVAGAYESGAPPGVARQCAAWTGRAGWGRVVRQGLTRGEGFGAAGESLGGTISNGIARRKGAKDTAAAHTSPIAPRWRGRRRTQISLGGGGPGRWEGERRPAEGGAGCG